jgi:hypothetical protein
VTPFAPNSEFIDTHVNPDTRRDKLAPDISIYLIDTWASFPATHVNDKATRSRSQNRPIRPIRAESADLTALEVLGAALGSGLGPQRADVVLLIATTMEPAKRLGLEAEGKAWLDAGSRASSMSSRTSRLTFTPAT